MLNPLFPISFLIRGGLMRPHPIYSKLRSAITGICGQRRKAIRCSGEILGDCDSNGISPLMSYTWSKSIDLGSGSLVADLTFRNVTDVGWERAVSSGSVPQRFVTSYTYALPVGHGKSLDVKNRVLAGV